MDGDGRREGEPRAALEDAAESAALGGLLRRARRLGRVQERVRAALPAPLAAECHVVTLESGHLRLLVSSSVAATALRFHQAAVLDALRSASGVPVQRLSVVVRPPSKPGGPESSGASRRPLGVSPAAADHLRSAAASEEDAQLREALERLAGRRR